MEDLRVCGNCKHWIGSDCNIYITDNVSEKEKACDSFEMKDHFADSSKKVSDNVNHPAHYTAGGIEYVDAMKACVSGLNEMEAACTSHALKYLWRWKHKNGAEDIRKCIWWLERLLKEVEDESKK